MCRVKSVFFSFSFCMFTFQKFWLGVVSGGTVSLSSTDKRASARKASFTLTCSFPKSMPCALRLILPTFPLMRASWMKFVVFTFNWVNFISSTITWLLNKGINCTSTTICWMSATVSFLARKAKLGLFLRESIGCNTFTPSTPNLRGKTSLTYCTDISIPVDSEAYAATCFTAQF